MSTIYKMVRNLLVYVAGFAPCSSAIASSVFPPLDQPNMLFGDGTILSGKPHFFQSPPMRGPVSGWKLLQWRQTEYLMPNNFARSEAGDVLVWTTPSKSLELRIKREREHVTYEMTQEGGVVESSGATDIFLSAEPMEKSLTLVKSVDLAVNVQIIRADIKFDDPASKNSGAVLAQLGANFRMRFVDPATKQTYSVMLGVPISTSRDRPPSHMGCHYFERKRTPQIVSVQSLSKDSLLDFKVGPPHKMNYNINQLLCATVRRDFVCKSDDGTEKQFKWPSAALDPSNWKIDGMTIGVETQDHFSKDGRRSRGSVSAGLSVSDLQVLQSNTMDSNDICTASVIPLDTGR